MMPRLCFGCNVRLYRGEQLLCTVCRDQLPLTEYNFTEENAVDRIFYGRIRIEKAAAMLFYSETGIVKNIIHYLKYKAQEPIGIFLGDWYGLILKDAPGLPPIDLVIPVPLHKKKLRKRGFNQVAAFGQRIAYHLHSQYEDSVLIKTTNSRTQTKKNRFYRWHGNKQLFALTDPFIVKNKTILLVDDVITTGATLEACAEVLKRGTGASIYIATMAMVP